MRPGIVVATMWVLVTVLAVLAMAVFWLQPATQELETALTRARTEIETLGEESGRRVGSRYEGGLTMARSTGDRVLENLRNELKRQARVQGAWFPGVELGPDGTPRPESFASRHSFHQDEIRRAITAVARQRIGEALEGIPVHQPAFVAERRLPRDLVEMEQVQRVSSAERILLDAAAAAGGFPYRALEARAGFESLPEDRLFRTMDVTLYLLMRPGDLPGVLRALLGAGEDGPVVSLEGLVTRPRPLPDSLRPDDPLFIEAEVHLGLSTLRR